MSQITCFPSARGPICFNCQSPLPDGRCHSIELCRVGEVCSVTGKSNYGTLLYKSRCVPQDACGEHHVSALIGKRVSLKDPIARSYEPQDCFQCCYSDICNRNCDNNAHDCSDLLRYSGLMASGVYNITTPITRAKIQVYCDMETDGGGWTIFEKRFNGSFDFHQTFKEYENGFGNVKSEHWLGLKYLYELTSNGVYELRTDIVRANKSKGYDVYDYFSLQPGSNYTLNLGERVKSSGVHTDAGWLNGNSNYTPVGNSFSTYDHDVDRSVIDSCATLFTGGWWYNDCYAINLNGLYLPGQTNTSSMCYDDHVGLLSSTIMFKKKQFTFQD